MIVLVRKGLFQQKKWSWSDSAICLWIAWNRKKTLECLGWQQTISEERQTLWQPSPGYSFIFPTFIFRSNLSRILLEKLLLLLSLSPTNVQQQRQQQQLTCDQCAEDTQSSCLRLHKNLDGRKRRKNTKPPSSWFIKTRGNPKLCNIGTNLSSNIILYIFLLCTFLTPFCL